MRKIFLQAILWILIFTTIATPEAAAQSTHPLDQAAVVFIQVECLNTSSGAITESSGSGFIFDENGRILTAHHVIACIDEEKRQLHRMPVKIRIGSPNKSPQVANVISESPEYDLAVLMLGGAQEGHRALPICSLRNPKAQARFVAAGFPEKAGYQPVDVTMGNAEAPGGLWAVAASFAPGMSGGPVVHNGRVVGLVKGGVPGVAAQALVTPLYKAENFIEPHLGQEIQDCDTLPPPPEAQLPPANSPKEPTEEEMKKAVVARFTSINAELATLSKQCNAREFRDNPLLALKCLQVCAASGGSCDVDFDLKGFRKIGCKEVPAKPGFDCDFVFSLDSTSPIMRQVLQAFGGSGGHGRGRFVRQSDGWLFLQAEQ